LEADVREFFAHHPVKQGAKQMEQHLERLRVAVACQERWNDLLRAPQKHLVNQAQLSAGDRPKTSSGWSDRSMIMSRIYTVLAAVGFVCGIVPWVHAQTTTDKVVVSYPSKSITNFPILETARQKGFFQKE